jgi:hypothetical protein
MSTYMGRHPALPPTNNLLQLPNQNNNTNNNTNNSSGKRKIKLIRSLSKSKIPPPDSQPQDTKPEEIEVPSEKEINIPPSAIRDTLLGDDKITLKVIALHYIYRPVLSFLPSSLFHLTTHSPFVILSHSILHSNALMTSCILITVISQTSFLAK